jgi:hypothetical protein
MNTFALQTSAERLANAQSKRRLAKLKFQQRLIDDTNNRYEKVLTIDKLLNNNNTFKQIGA